MAAVVTLRTGPGLIREPLTKALQVGTVGAAAARQLFPQHDAVATRRRTHGGRRERHFGPRAAAFRAFRRAVGIQPLVDGRRSFSQVPMRDEIHFDRSSASPARREICRNCAHSSLNPRGIVNTWKPASPVQPTPRRPGRRRSEKKSPIPGVYPLCASVTDG